MFDHGFQAHTFRKIKPAEEKATGISWALLAQVPVPPRGKTDGDWNAERSVPILMVRTRWDLSVLVRAQSL